MISRRRIFTAQDDETMTTLYKTGDWFPAEIADLLGYHREQIRQRLRYLGVEAPHFTKEQRRRMRLLRQGGKTYREIADEMGLHGDNSHRRVWRQIGKPRDEADTEITTKRYRAYTPPGIFDFSKDNLEVRT